MSFAWQNATKLHSHLKELYLSPYGLDMPGSKAPIFYTASVRIQGPLYPLRQVGIDIKQAGHCNWRGSADGLSYQRLYTLTTTMLPT